MKKQLVLIIESSKTWSDQVARELRRSGYHSFECHSIDEAKAALETKPEVILLDVALPDGDGIEFCREIKMNSVAKDALVILMSASMDASLDHQFLLWSGANSFLVKPFETKELIEAIERLQTGTTL